MEVTPRLIVAIVLFLFGTTFLWLTASFLGAGVKGEGTIWTAVQILALLTILGFVAAAYGAWRDALPWEQLALLSAIVGLAVVGAYWLGVQDVPAAANVVPNLVLHVMGSVVVIAVLLVPVLHDWLLAWLKPAV